MTLTSTTTKIQYNGDGSTVSFPITFIYWLNADIKVIHKDAAGTETTWTLGTQYTLTGGEGSTGTLTVEVAPTDYTPAIGETLTIKSIVPNTQTTTLPLGGALPSSSIEERLDKNVRLIQQRGEELDRAMLLSEASALSNLTFPAPGAGNYIRWAADGLSLEAVSAVNDSGNFLQSGTGAVSRSVTSKLGEVVSVKDFGATGDGVTDDTAKIQAAIDAAGDGSSVFFPAGTYLLSASLTVTNQSIQIIGQGMGVTILKWNTTVTNGITGSFNNRTQQLHMRDMSLKTDQAGGGTAINATWPAPSWTSVACTLENLEIIPDVLTSDYWTKGIVLDNGWNSSLRNIWIRGQDNSRLMTTGIELDGNSNDVNISDCHIYFCVTGIQLTGAVQGTDVISSQIIFVTTGISAAATGGVWLVVIGCHLSAFTTGILCNNLTQAYFAGNNIYKRSNSTGAFVGIQGTSTSSVKVIGNEFFIEPGATGTSNAVVFVSGTRYTIIGNICESNFGTLIWMQAGSSRYNVSDNRHDGTGTCVLASGTQNNIIKNNYPTAIQVFAANDLTPSVANDLNGLWNTANTTPMKSITTFDDGYTGQIIHVLANDAFTTLVHGATLILRGGVNYVMGNGETCTLRRDASLWREISRSA